MEPELLQVLHHENHMAQYERTSSSSSSSSSTENIDQIQPNLFDDFHGDDLDMDSLSDPSALNAFVDLEGRLLREELLFSSDDLQTILRTDLADGMGSSLPNEGTCDSLFNVVDSLQMDFETHNPSSPLSQYSDNSRSPSTSSSSYDTDLNFDRQHHYPQCDFSPPCSLDSPPLTPPEIKVDMAVVTLSPDQLLLTNIVAPNNIRTTTPEPKKGDNTSMSKNLGSGKINKRGRSASHDDPPDVQALKRHIRMIRNRESASLSRMKKKEYVTGLESRIKDLEKENQVLRQENVYLRSKVQNSETDVVKSPLLTFNKKKSQAGLVAKVALLGVFGFIMINFHPRHTPHSIREESLRSNATGVPSRTLSNLRVAENEVESISIASLLTEKRKFLPSNAKYYQDVQMNYTTTYLNHSGSRNHGRIMGHDFELGSKNHTNSSSHSAIGAIPTSYLNGTSYFQNDRNPIEAGHHSSSLRNVTNQTTTDKRVGRSWRLRSRGVNKRHLKYSTDEPGSLKTATSVFPTFVGSPVSNSSKIDDSKQSDGCPSSFNLTESLRVKSNLENIFGNEKKRLKGPPAAVVEEPIAYSLVSRHKQKRAKPVVTETTINRDLALYNGEKEKRTHSILEKLERREDTFYVVSLAQENQLLLSAKNANETTRPKMTLLLPWRNETLKEDIILRIDCEVFQVAIA